jgi:hypothetical protein
VRRTTDLEGTATLVRSAINGRTARQEVRRCDGTTITYVSDELGSVTEGHGKMHSDEAAQFVREEAYSCPKRGCRTQEKVVASWPGEGVD